MSDQQTTSNPWLRPMSAQLLVRKDPPRPAPEPVGPYTPNEPDANEAIYAARAAAARQQAEARSSANPLSPVQLAVEQAAQEAHAARQATEPSQPDAVFYQQATGVQQAAPAPIQPEQPTQPHRLPLSAYAAQSEEPAITRQANEAALADPMLEEEARQTTSPRRRRMVMRQEREAQQEANEASMESIPSMPQLPVMPPVVLPQENEAADPDTEAAYTDVFEAEAPVETAAPEAEEETAESEPTEVAPEADPQPVPQPDPQPDTDCDLTLSQLDPAAPSDDYFRLPLENPLKAYAWYTDEVLDEEDDPEEDCMDTSAMPVPVPVSTLDIPKVRRGKRVLSFLLVLMLLLAAGGYLWISGHGEVLYRKALQLVENLKTPTVPTGAMTVSPESAALPAVLTVTLTTGSDISALELTDDDQQPLTADITSQPQDSQTLWTCTLRLDTAYSGYIRAKCLCPDGQWRMASQKHYVNVN